MRKMGLFLVGAMLLCFMSVTWVEGQPGQKGKGFGGFGGQQTAVNLFNREDVKKELEITEDQAEKLPAEVMAAVGRVLSEKQFKRFKQIDLQQRGNNVFKDKTIQKQLKLTDDQVKNIGGVLDDTDKALSEIKGGKGGFGGFDKESQEKRATIRKEAKEKILTVLSKDQRATYRDMIGEEFKFQQFGIPGKGKDLPKKKNDAE
jgi:hypothetical protein